MSNVDTAGLTYDSLRLSSEAYQYFYQSYRNIDYLS